ncbi:MAG: tRNA (adenosine(37)-N6)-threonylcarbamoyltransferase complex dimerization subunit type 1 TsaB [Desulfobacteraceae bacterium]|nr:tRNA (adenosine(37)-N6)-threonylcarbamoyltransferase complex dimerization subunit type 1 TsaB [Desulfobacteraceae bacterium]
MKLLAVDTATQVCGVALSIDGQLQVELNLFKRQTHATCLMGAIESVLALAGMAADDIDAFAVNRGPGSFTGLRIGISTVKGLAMAAGKPIAGVSSLAILAHQAYAAGDSLICPMLDARRQEVYWALYRYNGKGLMQLIPEQVGSVTEVLNNIDKLCIFIGDGAQHYRPLIQQTLKDKARWAPDNQHTLKSSMLARLAYYKLRDGQEDDLRTFGPAYIRKSDAEMNLKKNKFDGIE